jgi:hypothetical protein
MLASFVAQGEPARRMQLRSTAEMSAGADGVRFKALAWAERPAGL